MEGILFAFYFAVATTIVVFLVAVHGVTHYDTNRIPEFYENKQEEKH